VPGCSKEGAGLTAYLAWLHWGRKRIKTFIREREERHANYVEGEVEGRIEREASGFALIGPGEEGWRLAEVLKGGAGPRPEFF